MRACKEDLLLLLRLLRKSIGHIQQSRFVSCQTSQTRARARGDKTSRARTLRAAATLRHEREIGQARRGVGVGVGDVCQRSRMYTLEMYSAASKHTR